MTGKSIDYYDSMSSPWTYLGHLRFEDLCRRFGLTINHKPMDLLKVWSVSGGLPLRERAKQRQAYRHQELRRWRELLAVPCNLEPAYHPVADRRACYLAIAAMPTAVTTNQIPLCSATPAMPAFCMNLTARM